MWGPGRFLPLPPSPSLSPWLSSVPVTWTPVAPRTGWTLWRLRAVPVPATPIVSSIFCSGGIALGHLLRHPSPHWVRCPSCQATCRAAWQSSTRLPPLACLGVSHVGKGPALCSAWCVIPRTGAGPQQELSTCGTHGRLGGRGLGRPSRGGLEPNDLGASPGSFSTLSR